MTYKDLLTGLSTRNELEDFMSSHLRNGHSGMLLEIDIHDFRGINLKYGYQMGDRLLKRVARIAENMAEGCGVAARIGPDIFAIFFTEEAKREQIYQNHNNISQMVEKAGQELEMEDSVLSTAVLVYAAEYERPGKVFQRASIVMVSEKRKVSKIEVRHNGPVFKDMSVISEELKEKGSVEGAYLQDYETFKRIYQFVARGLERSGDSAYLLLLTLEEDEDELDPERMEGLMEELYEIIRNALRKGDAFTQYSSSQYLLMVLGTSSENARKIGERIKSRYEAGLERKICSDIEYDIYPLG